MLKRCPRCNTEKNVSEFCNNKSTKDGLNCYCKSCARLSHKISYNTNRGTKRAYDKRVRSTPEGRAKKLHKSAKERADKKAISFSLPLVWIEERLRSGICEVTGIKLNLSADGIDPWSPSLDRRDNAQGYTPENTQVVCWIYNAAKGPFSEYDVKTLAEAVCRNQ